MQPCPEEGGIFNVGPRSDLGALAAGLAAVGLIAARFASFAPLHGAGVGVAGVDLGVPPLDPEVDRGMICGSMAMLRDTKAALEGFGLEEGSNSTPGTFVVERAFVD